MTFQRSILPIRCVSDVKVSLIRNIGSDSGLTLEVELLVSLLGGFAVAALSVERDSRTTGQNHRFIRTETRSEGEHGLNLQNISSWPQISNLENKNDMNEEVIMEPAVSLDSDQQGAEHRVLVLEDFSFIFG